MNRDQAYYVAAQKECPRCGIPCRCGERARADAELRKPTALPGTPSVKHAFANAVELTRAREAAQRCGIREGETLAELILRLYSETLSDTD